MARPRIHSGQEAAVSKFNLGFVDAAAARNDTPRVMPRGRADATVRRQFSYLRGYLAIMGFLTILAVASFSVALWRLFHFAH